MGKAYVEFKVLLQEAIGNRSQKDFAESAGISKEHLNRMLRDGDINQPSRSTLKKIASASGIDYERLLTACEYDVDFEKTKNTSLELKKRATLPTLRRVKKCVEDIHRGFSETVKNNPIFDDIEDLLELVDLLYSVEDIEYTLSEERDFGDIKHNNADCSRIITASWKDEYFEAEMEILLWYAFLSRGGIVVTAVEFDKESLEKSGSKIIAQQAFMEKSQDKGENTLVVPKNHVSYQTGNFVYSIKFISPRKEVSQSDIRFARRVEEFKRVKGMSEKEAFLAALFGDPDRPKRIMSVEGRGFYLDETPDYVVMNFLDYHKDTFLSIEDQDTEEIFRALIKGEKNLDNAFEQYITKDNGAHGHWGAAVADIIRIETGVHVEMWGYRKSEDLGNRPCIMVSQAMPWEFTGKEKEMDKDELVHTLDRYAKELRSYEGYVHYLMEIDAKD